jgi:hypothetical protein
MRTTSLLALTLIAALGCGLEPTSTELEPALLSKGQGGGGGGGGKATDPTATWIIPNAGYSLRSDNHSLYTAEGLSTYADGVCGVAAKIFATTAASNSGDATIGMDAPKKGCGRRVTLVYPDGNSETIRTFGNLQQLQNTTTLIPIGTRELRTLIINPSAYSNNPSRCGRLLFGTGSLGSGVGSDQVWVERVDARTWHVYSQDEPNTKVWCRDEDSLINMTVSFTIVASRDLPE